MNPGRGFLRINFEILKERLKSDASGEYVAVKLKEDWQPEQIAGRIDKPGLSISHEAI